ncbi:MAG TPA: DoxX family protein [Stellaceae bacterium]|nr:DoxX family protein [Stellaceae bacterium]
MPDTARWRLALEPHLLSLLRLVVGLLYLQHGLNKLLDFPSAPHHSAYHLFTLVPGLAGLLETIGGFLVTIGLYTRIAAFILSGEMAFAYFMAHAPRSPFPLQNGGEPAILYCFIFLYLAVAGAGFWSIDRLRARR